MTYKIALLDDEIDFLKKLSSCFQDYPQIETDYFIDPNELINRLENMIVFMLIMKWIK